MVRAAVVVGVGRVTKHPRKGQDGGFTPVTLMQEALGIALDDTGVSHDSVLGAIDTMGMPGFNMAGETNNPPWLLAKKMGIDLLPGRDCNTGQGSSGQLYMCQFCNDIADGIETGIALVAQGEARHSLRQVMKSGQGRSLPHDEDAPSRPTTLRIVDGRGVVRVGEEEMMRQEAMHGLSAPNWAYAVYDNAVRAADGRSIEDHQLYIGQIFADYSKVAAKPENQEHAWFPDERTAEEVGIPVPSNRMIGFPYTKYMCAFNEIDMGAAVLLTSVGKAKELGISPAKFCYIHATASTEEDSSLLSRPNYYTSTQHEVGFKQLLANAGKTAADVSGYDICTWCQQLVQSAELRFADTLPNAVGQTRPSRSTPRSRPRPSLSLSTSQRAGPSPAGTPRTALPAPATACTPSPPASRRRAATRLATT